MAHTINGIITSFKYNGELPNVILVGNYYLIPFENEYNKNYFDQILEPYEELTKKTRKTLKELSYKGKCAYIETNYFGGSGVQMSEAWGNGQRINGPLISFDGIENPKIPKKVTLVEDSINETLRTIGIFKHEGKDEFDSVRLSCYRLNNEIIAEYIKNKLGKI